MTTQSVNDQLNEAKAALNWIKGEAEFIDSYFNGDFATWYNSILKTRKRAKVIKEKCDVIINCMNAIEEDYEEKWNSIKGLAEDHPIDEGDI